jgi:hypothetical protein
LKAEGHAPGASAVSGQSCLIKAAIAPACANDDFPTPELPSRIGSLLDMAASVVITSVVSRALPKK